VRIKLKTPKARRDARKSQSQNLPMKQTKKPPKPSTLLRSLEAGLRGRQIPDCTRDNTSHKTTRVIRSDMRDRRLLPAADAAWPAGGAIANSATAWVGSLGVTFDLRFILAFPLPVTPEIPSGIAFDNAD
jgi:hypothetical protein